MTIRIIAAFCVAVWATLHVPHTNAELLLYYDFNDASDPDIVLDQSGKDNHGDVIEAEYTDEGDGLSAQADDRAMDFGFLDDGRYVEVTTAFDGAFETITDNDQFTLSLWINGIEQPANQWTFYAGPGRQFGAHTPWGDSTIYFDVAGCCGPTQRINLNEPDPSLYSEEWNHYVFVKDEFYTAIFQNGELWHDSGDEEKDPLGIIEELYVGSGPPGDQRSYSGLIDEFKLWDTPLTEEEIQQLFEEGIGGGPSVPGDYNKDTLVDAADVDLQSAAMKDPNPDLGVFDENSDGQVDFQDRRIWTHDHAKTWIGDADLDGEFNSGDLVSVFASGKFETNEMAGWAEGDWDGDMMFGSGDFVVAFSDGGYEQGVFVPAAVPEPAAMNLIALGMLLSLSWRRRSSLNRPRIAWS